jgi:copper chaperone CopZ
MDDAAAPAPAAAGKLEKSYFDVLGICCPSEVPLVEKLLEPLPGVHKVSVVVPSRTVIVLHDASAISQAQIGKPNRHAVAGSRLRPRCFPSRFHSPPPGGSRGTKNNFFCSVSWSPPLAGGEIFVRLLLALRVSGE